MISILLFLSTFATSGQMASICAHDCEKESVILGDSSHSLDVDSTSFPDDDCGTSNHIHSCCSHFSFVHIKMLVSEVTRFDSVLFTLSSESWDLSPFLEGPFQPPRV